jgi:hypothetical protein
MVRSPSHTVVGGTELLSHPLLDEDLHLLPQSQDRDQGQEDPGQPDVLAVMAAAAALTGAELLYWLELGPLVSSKL